MRPRQLFLFDIDGTLIGTMGAGLRALDRAVVELHGHERSCEGIRADGKTDPAIIIEILERLHGRAPDDTQIEAVLDRYLEHLRGEVERSPYKVMPGVGAALDLLDERGHVLGLATGNVARGAEIKLTRGDLWRRFGFGGYGSDSADRGRLVAHCQPEALLGLVEGCVWELIVPSADLPSFKQNHLISGTIRRSDGVHARVVSETPPNALAKPISPTLEDAYLYALTADRQAVAA